MDFSSLINLTREIREIEPREELVIFGSASILVSFPEETDQHGWLLLKTNEVLKKAILASNQLPNDDAMLKETNS